MLHQQNRTVVQTIIAPTAQWCNAASLTDKTAKLQYNIGRMQCLRWQKQSSASSSGKTVSGGLSSCCQPFFLVFCDLHLYIFICVFVLAVHFLFTYLSGGGGSSWLVALREAVLYQIGYFFTHCVNGP